MSVDYPNIQTMLILRCSWRQYHWWVSVHFRKTIMATRAAMTASGKWTKNNVHRPHHSSAFQVSYFTSCDGADIIARNGWRRQPLHEQHNAAYHGFLFRQLVPNFCWNDTWFPLYEFSSTSSSSKWGATALQYSAKKLSMQDEATHTAKIHFKYVWWRIYMVNAKD